jgi:hypothetical protein
MSRSDFRYISALIRAQAIASLIHKAREAPQPAAATFRDSLGAGEMLTKTINQARETSDETDFAMDEGKQLDSSGLTRY